MLDSFAPKSVIVGIDGSDAAIRAAQWAVDEVADTDVPLRLLYVRDLNSGASRAETRAAFEAGEAAVYAAYDAVVAMGQAVKIEMEIVEGRPVPMLVQASKSTQLICVGDVGAGRLSPAGFGSTATELIQHAHCSVAVVRGGMPHHDEKRSVVAYVVGSLDDEFAVQRGFEEAERRDAPLVLMMAWRSGLEDLQDDAALTEQERRKHDVLDHYAALWSPHYPRVTVRTVVKYGPFLNYLADNAASVQVAVVGATAVHELRKLISPAADPALRHSDFTVIVAR
ncbi:universal stress protein [Mycobacterium paraterrae]|uniref:Universal stress protein n=1 Tax=Mycobacterium paraterrae TaxID=577492 RepID=A0ABY3VTL8_9MYCO|nr:universal stress protein [Mycobacterium paraterrae]UMB70879.1 universal stress protein [Mycobacterium paraterrae]